MRVNVGQSPPPSPHTPLTPHSSQNTLPSSLRFHRSSSSLSLTRPVNRKSTAQNNPLRISCSASFDGPIDHFSPKPRKPTSFLHVDVLEPSLLGISPAPPDWPARDAVLRECIARRANSIDIPLSLRIIKMKQKFQRLENVELSDIDNNSPINNICCSTLYIIKEVQREILLHEELDDGVVSKVQREMTSSFVWLFKEVFAKTPDLMLHVLLLTCNFTSFSLQSLNHVDVEREKVESLRKSRGLGLREELEGNEVGLWNSMVEEVERMKGGEGLDQGLGLGLVRDGDKEGENDEGEERGDVVVKEGKKFEFVSPVKIEIERGDYEEYHRTDLTYQIGLFQEPNNTLLLSNYAQFLCLVSRDFDRAEECFNRALQLDPDADVMSQYANFLWVVKKDLWRAEERFLQAMSAEPDNSYHASRYASFLWSTGGEDTCYSLEPPPGKS